MKNRILKIVGLAVLVTAMAGCGSTPEEDTNGAAEAADRAIAEAQAAVSQAQERDCVWRDSNEILDDAKAARDEGDYDEAQRLAEEALFQAEKALEQCDEAKDEGAAADERAGGADAAGRSYEVVRGDNLWDIAGKATIYDNPYQWPLIFRANRGQIEDADLIFPGQNFDIRMDYSGAEVEAAEEHARTRGEWALGRTEDSDRRYLSR